MNPKIQRVQEEFNRQLEKVDQQLEEVKAVNVSLNQRCEDLTRENQRLEANERQVNGTVCFFCSAI